MLLDKKWLQLQNNDYDANLILLSPGYKLKNGRLWYLFTAQPHSESVKLTLMIFSLMVCRNIFYEYLHERNIKDMS